jgi:hypothetical protein
MTKTKLKQLNRIINLLLSISYIHEENPRGSSNQYMFSTDTMLEHSEKLKTNLTKLFISYQDYEYNFFHIPYILDFSNLNEAYLLHNYIQNHQLFKLLSSRIIPHSKEHPTVGKLLITYKGFPFHLNKDIYKNGLKHFSQFQLYTHKTKEAL